MGAATAKVQTAVFDPDAEAPASRETRRPARERFARRTAPLFALPAQNRYGVICASTRKTSRRSKTSEPLVTPKQVANAIWSANRFSICARRGGQAGVQRRCRLAGAIRANLRRSRSVFAGPGEAFGEIDQAAPSPRFAGTHSRPGADRGIPARARRPCRFAARSLLGESLTPLGAKLRFPALRLRPVARVARRRRARNPPRPAGRHFAWHSPGRFDILDRHQ